MTTKVFTLEAMTFGVDRLIPYMRRVCGGYAVSEGRQQIPIRYPASLDPNRTGSISTGANMLDDAINSTPGPKVVLGYSQGAQVCGAWMRRYAQTCTVPPHELWFLLIGNPERKFGHKPDVPNQFWTPNWTRYYTRDVARDGDLWAHWTPGKPTGPLSAGTHTAYWSVNPFDPTAAVFRENNTDYVVVP